MTFFLFIIDFLQCLAIVTERWLIGQCHLDDLAFLIMSSHTCCVSRTDTTWSPTPGTWLWMLLLPQPTDISFTPVHLTFKKFRLYLNVLPNPFQTTHQWPEFLPKMQVDVQAPIKVPELQSCHPTITFITWWEPRRLSCLPDCPNYFPQSDFFSIQLSAVFII